MSPEMVAASFHAFHVNGLNSLIYALSTNWCLIFLVIAAAASAVLGITTESAGIVREEQNIL